MLTQTLERLGLTKDESTRLTQEEREAREEVQALRRKVREKDRAASRARSERDHRTARRLEREAGELEEKLEAAREEAERATTARQLFVREEAGPEAVERLEAAEDRLRGHLEAIGRDVADRLPEALDAMETLADAERDARRLEDELEHADRGPLRAARKRLGADADALEVLGLFTLRTADACRVRDAGFEGLWSARGVEVRDASLLHAAPPWRGTEREDAQRGRLPLARDYHP